MRLMWRAVIGRCSTPDCGLDYELVPTSWKERGKAKRGELPCPDCKCYEAVVLAIGNCISQGGRAITKAGEIVSTTLLVPCKNCLRDFLYTASSEEDALRAKHGAEICVLCQQLERGKNGKTCMG